MRSIILKEFIIGQNDAGQRLDRFIAKAVPALPPSLAQKYIRLKRIKIGGKAAARDHKLDCGEVVQMYVNDEFFEAKRDENAYQKISGPGLEIIYEDANILLINKPAGVLCHSDETYDYASLISRAQAYLYQKGEWRPSDENAFAPALCNRVDRNTSGIVIAAKNAQSLRIINDKLKIREIERYYLAVVHGSPKQKSRRLDGYIFKDSVKNKVYVSKDSRPGTTSASMEYKVIATTGNLSLLECRLITGRTHQIRAQLADIGYPLLGDGKYGSERLNKPYGENRQALCSYKVVFKFRTSAGALAYLNNSSFELHGVPFVNKYFPAIDI